jgi:homoserine kinase type II
MAERIWVTDARASSTTLQAVADYFDLGTIEAVELAPGTNANFRVGTTRGRFVFKIVVNTTREDLEAGLPYLQRLEAHNFPATAYYLTAANGTAIYLDGDCVAVALRQLPGDMPRSSRSVCRQVGRALAQLHLVPAEGLPPKPHWLDHTYLSQALAQATAQVGEDRLPLVLRAYAALEAFRPQEMPQSIIHGDLDHTNCLFVGETLSALLDWQEIGVGAPVLDVGMTVLGFCFVGEPVRFAPELCRSLVAGYSEIRHFSPAEAVNIERAVKYAALTQSVWSLLHLEQYHPGEPLDETNTLYWHFGLDTWSLA